MSATVADTANITRVLAAVDEVEAALANLETVLDEVTDRSDLQLADALTATATLDATLHDLKCHLNETWHVEDFTMPQASTAERP